MLATWPDIAYAVQSLSKYMQNPGDSHCNVAEHCLRYLAGTRNYMLTYSRDQPTTPYMYTDANWVQVQMIAAWSI